MPLFRKRGNGEDEERDSSRDRFLNQQDILDRLEEEIFRADRFGRALVILCVVPQLVPGESPAAGEIAFARDVVAAQLRFSDRVGTLEDGTLVAVLPETEATSARVVAHRIAADLTVRSTGANRRNWLVGASTFPDDGSDPPAMVAAAMGRAQR